MTLRSRRLLIRRRLALSTVLVFSWLCLEARLLAPAVQAADGAMTTGYLNLRIAPSTTSTILAIVPPEVALTVNGEPNGEYSPVVFGERSGWAATELLRIETRNASLPSANLAESQSATAGVARLIESVNLRTGPGTDFDALGVVDAGT